MNTKELVRNYTISTDENDMFITILKNGKTFYTNYNEGLYDIMKSGIFTTARTNGTKQGDYLKFTCTHSNLHAYFHHIVFCYYYRGLNKSNYIEVLTRFRNELSASNLNIDHLQDGNFNNRKWNLSIMSKSYNSQKRSVERRFKGIFDIVSACDGNGYRVQFTYLNKGIYTNRYYCDTPDELNKLLKYLKNYKWVLRKSREGVILQDNSYFCSGDFENNISKNNNISYLLQNDKIHDMQKYITELDKGIFMKIKGLFYNQKYGIITASNGCCQR